MYILWCSVLCCAVHVHISNYAYAYARMYTQHGKCLFQFSNIDIFQLSHLSFNEAALYTCVTYFGGETEWKEINDCLFTISPDSQVESLANEMPSFWHSTAYAIEQRENVRYEAVHTATFNVDKIQWNIYCTSTAERQITNAVFSVVMLAQLQSFYSPIQS